MSQSKLSSAPQGPSSTERAVSPPDAVKSTVSPVTLRTGKRLSDEEFTPHDQEATVPVDAALTEEAQRDEEATAPVDAASATGEAPSAQESSALAVETAAASPTNSNLSKLGLGALALLGLAAAVAGGGGGDSKVTPQVPSQPSGDDGKPQVPSQPSGSDSKPPPVQVPGVGTKPINGQGVVTVSGVVDGAEWEFSLDDGDTWHKGDGNGVSASDLVEGPNTITIVQTDKDGNRSDAVVVVVIKDSIIEKPVLGTSTGTGAINDTGSISVGGIENNGKWEFSVDGGQTWRPGTGGSISGAELNEGDNTVIVKQTDEAGNVATATIDVVKDSIIEKPVLGTSTGTGAINDTGSISVGGIENNGKWEFSVDGGQTWRPGTGGAISGAELNEGDNTVIVKQTDEAGNVATATIDVVKDSIIDKPVLGTSTGTGAINDTGSISVGGIENNGKWEFSVDGGQTWKPGTGGSISGAELNEGDNTVTVKQTDEAGNVATATIDVVKDSIIDKPVLGTSTGTGAINDAGSISVGGIENNGKWEFSVDGGQTWRPGTGGSISGAELNEGDNTVIVKQTDEAGNMATATIDVVKDSIIDKPVLGTSTGTGAINDTGSISVGGIENNGKWEFSVDGGQTWKPGTGGSISGAELNEGDNTVTVKQTDEAGNVATATIDVVKDSIIDKPVLGTSTGTGAINDTGSISVGGIENNGKWEFSVDGGQTWRPGTGGAISGAELNEGDNTVTVKQTDEAGNVATATIDVVKDSIIDKPVLGTSTGTGAINDTGSISVGGIENNGKWEFSVDGGQTWKPGTGGSISGAELNEGDNTVTVKQTDEAGNVATATIDVVKDSIIDKPVLGTSTGTGAINDAGSISVGGIENNGKWEFSVDGGQTWRPGTGGAISGVELKEGDNTVTVKQTDAAGNVATATITVVKDTLIDKPIIGTSTGTGSINNTGSITVSGIENNGKWEFSTDGGQTWRPGNGGTISGAELNEGDNTVIVKQTDEAGNVATATIDVVKDSIIDKPVLGTSTGTGAINDAGSISVGGIENNGKWEFSVDGGQTWRPGTGGSISGAELNEGDNTVIVKQTDEAGNVATATIDVVKDSLIEKPVLGTSTGTGAINDAGSINVGGIENNGKWEFSVDGGQTWRPGTGGSISGAELNEGDNTVTVKQTDEAGNVATATIDVVKDSLIEKPVLGTSTGTGAINDAGSINVGGIENNGKWEFSVDGGQTWRPGTGGAISGAELKEGDNSVTVKQTDAAGNVATATITVVKDTLIDKPIIGTSTGTGSINNTGSVTVSGIESSGKWEFSTDGGQTWKPGTGNAISGAELKEGDNTITVKQTDAAGNVATATITVVKDTLIDKPIVGTSTGTGSINNTGSITVSGIENNGKWEFSVDGGQTWKPGTGGAISGAELKEGDNSVTVKQTDAAGNVATATITVVKDTLIDKPIVGTSTGTGSINNTGSVTVSGIESNGKWEFSTDGGQTWRPGTGGAISGAELNEGDNTVTVKQTDAAGNVATATITVVKDTLIDKPIVGTSTGTGSINNTGSVTVSGIENNGKWEFSTDGGQTWKPGTGNAISGVELKEGDNTVTVKQTDAAGNVATATITVVKDTLIDKPIVGTSTGTGSINNTGSVTVSGIENNGKWEFSTDGGQTWKPGTGNAIYGAELNEGDNTVIVKQTDAAGNEAINAITVSKDLKVDEPTVTTSTGGAINDAGWVNVGQIESGATWAYSLDNGKTWIEGTEPKIPGSVLSEGDNTLIIRQTDLAGNSASSTVLVVKDLVAAAPTLSLATDSGAVGDGLTNSGVLTVSGIESGARWEYSIDGADWQEGSGRSIADPGYANASHTVRVRQTDPAGNTSATASLTFTIDKLAPSVPVVSLELDSGEPGDLYTSASTLLLSGLEVGGAVFIETEGKRWSSHDLASSSISYWLPAFSSDGPKSVLIRQADKAGNQSTTRSFFFTLDTKAPDPVALSLATDSGAVGDRLTNSGVLDVSGIEAGARWEYSIDGANWQEGTGRTIADPGYANATHTVRVRQTDIAGNQSAESTFTFTIDKAAPVTPQVSLRYDGGSAGNPLTNSPDLKLSGLEVGSKIHVFKEGQWYVFEAHADTGFFHLPGFASDGPKTVLVKQVDAAGNESATASFDFTLDTKAPDAVDLSLVNDTGVAGDGRTSDATIKLSGLESDATWKYSLDGGITWTTGAGQVIAGSALNEGANMVTVAQIDRAGNQGASSSITVHKDTLVVAPAIKMPAAGSRAEFDASEEGFAYVVSASAADTSSMAALDALPPDQCHRVDVAAGGRVELSALSGLPDGYYRVVFSDKAGNLAAATTAGGMKHVQVQGGEILSTQVVMGTSGNDVLTAPNGGGAMISGDGFDTFVFSSGIKGVFDVDLHAIDTLDLRSLGLDKDRFFLEREQRFQRGTHQGKAAILIDWEATGDFTNPDVVLVSATASNPSVLYDDNGTGRMFPF